MPPGKAPQVFINYRTEDTGPVAKHLAEVLQRELQHGRGFLDHERIEGGEPWPDRLRSAVNESSVLLALVGKQWLRLQNKHGIRRLDAKDDWVRQEIHVALDAKK